MTEYEACGKIVVDGKKLLAYLGLKDDDTLSAEMVCKELLKLSYEELKELGLLIELPKLVQFDLPKVDELFDIGEPSPDFTSDELKRRIKYEKNPMAKMQLQRELAYVNAWEGKHRRGKCKRRD